MLRFFMVRENGSEMAPVSPNERLNVYLKESDESTLDFDTYDLKRGLEKTSKDPSSLTLLSLLESIYTFCGSEWWRQNANLI